MIGAPHMTKIVKKVTLKHGTDIKIISNEEGLLGAMALWRDRQ